MQENTAKILFVDDEESQRNAFRHLVSAESWSCRLAAGPEEALRLLATEKFDLLVTDMEMPGTDGIALLKEARRKYPGLIRLLMTESGRDNTTSTALAESNAQQIIPKPWIDQEFKEIIRSALRQSASMQKFNPEFQILINSISALPSLPENYSQIQDYIASDNVDIDKMASFIEQDVSISSTLLHWANSALFGQRFRVDTIKKAIVVLGTDIVTSLLLAEAVSQSMAQSIPEIDGFEIDKYKYHSIATAIIARLLIKSLHVSNTDLQDRAFIAGLLHDLGKLVAASYFSAQFSAALQQANTQNCPLYEVETGSLGTTHAELGAFLAEWWNLPHFIVNAIKLHHDTKESPVESEVVKAVNLANLLSYRIGFGCRAEEFERTIDQEIWNRFYLSEESVEIFRSVTETTILTLGKKY